MEIYVACLASYNSGILHGRHIDVTLGIEHVREEIAAMLRESPEPNVRVECPECDGRKTRLIASCVSPEREDCPECNGEGTVPSAEEWAVHDYDGLPSSFGEYPDLEAICRYAELVDEHGPAFAAWADYHGHDDDLAVDVDAFYDAYIGEFDGWADVAYHYVEETGMLHGVRDSLARYFDFEAYGRDLSFDGFESDGHFFWNR